MNGVHPHAPRQDRRRDAEHVDRAPNDYRGRLYGRAPRRANFCRRQSGQRHTTQEQPFEVIVEYPFHPLYGKRIIVNRRTVHGGLVHFASEGPDGCRALLPAWMTEPGAAALSVVEMPRLSLDALRELSSLVRTLPVASSPPSATTRTEEGSDGTPTQSAIGTVRSSVSKKQHRSQTSTTRSNGAHGSHRTSQASTQRMCELQSGKEGDKQ